MIRYMEYKHKIIKIWYSIYTIATMKNNYYKFEDMFSKNLSPLNNFCMRVNSTNQPII